MFSGMRFNFPLAEIFEYATDNLNLLMPVITLVLGVLLFGLLMDTVTDTLMNIYNRVVRHKRLAEDDDDSDGEY